TIEKLVNSALNSPSFTFFVPIIAYADKPNVIQKAGTPFHYLGFTLVSPHAGKNLSSLSNKTQIIKNFGGNCYLIYRKERDIEGDDSTFYYSLEELDFLARNFLLHFHRSLLITDAIATHHVGSTIGLSNDGDKEYSNKRFFLIHRNRWFYLLKNYQIKTLVLIIPPLILSELSLLLFNFIFLKDKLTIFKSYRSLAKNWTVLLQNRRQVQANRVCKDKNWLEAEHLRFTATTAKGKISRLSLKVLDFSFSKYGQIVLGIK
ncbi:MAG TPA: hypothetical protein DCP10_04485, partial [Bacteroidales bacterium]|nr:hypothetical protein [Bacteroidales bacterium]